MNDDSNDDTGGGRSRQQRAERRRAAVLTVALVSFALLAAACGGDGSSTAGGTPYQQALAYAQCMRSNGEPGFPDPDSQGLFRTSARLTSTLLGICRPLRPAGTCSRPIRRARCSSGRLSAGS